MDHVLVLNNPIISLKIDSNLPLLCWIWGLVLFWEGTQGKPSFFSKQKSCHDLLLGQFLKLSNSRQGTFSRSFLKYFSYKCLVCYLFLLRIPHPFFLSHFLIRQILPPKVENNKMKEKTMNRKKPLEGWTLWLLSMKTWLLLLIQCIFTLSLILTMWMFAWI